MRKYFFFLILSFTLALAGCGGSSGGSGSDDGDDVVTIATNSAASFTVLSSDAVRSRNSEEWVEYMELQLNAALAPLNQINGLLPETMVVNYDECGFVNAYYQPATRSITICDEFVDSILAFWSARQPDDAINFTARSINHVLYHEIGHAIVDVLNVPILGNYESVADGIAAVLAGETGRSFDAVVSSEVLSDSDSSFADVHINGEDRQGDIICWAAGSDGGIVFNNSLSAYITPFIQNDRNCQDFYENQLASIITLIPQLSALKESNVTNPDIIALSNPSPAKLPSLESGVQLVTALRNGADDLWNCSASNRSNRVLYVFRVTIGAYRESAEGTDTLPYGFEALSSTSVQLDYTTIDFSEVIDQISFTNDNQFSGSSNSDGALVCVRRVNVAA